MTIQVSHDARYILVGDQNGYLACYEMEWPRLEPYEPLLDKSISLLGGAVIAGGENEDKAYMLRPNGTVIWSFPTSGKVNTVAISDNGEYSIVGSDYTIYFLGTYDNVQPRWSYISQGKILKVDMSADGNCVVVGDDSGNIHYWSNAPNLSGTNPDPDWTFTSAKLADILSVSISDDGTRIGAGGKDSKIYFLNKNGNLLWESAYSGLKDVLAVAVSNDGRYLVAGTKGNYLYYFNDHSGQPEWQYQASHDIQAVAITYYGDYVAAGSDHEDVYFFDAFNGALLWSYDGHAKPVDIELSYGGRYMASICDQGRVYYWDTRSSSPMWTWKTGNSKLNELGMSEDGSIVVAGGDQGEVNYWFGAYSFMGSEEGGSKKYGAGPAWSIDLGKVKARAVAVNSIVGPWISFTKTDVIEHATLSSDTEIVFVDADNNIYEGALSMVMDTSSRKVWHVESRGWYQYPETGRIDKWDQVKLFFTYPGEPHGVASRTLPFGKYKVYLTLRGLTSDGTPYSQQIDAGTITISPIGEVTIDKIPSNIATPYTAAAYHDSTIVSGTYKDLSARDDDYLKVGSYATSTVTNTSNPSLYTLLTGTLSSGSISNLASNDEDYLTVASNAVYSDTTYYPSSYSLLDSTSLVSGTVATLTTVDGNGMVFQSYPTQYNPSSKSKAYVAYASDTGTSKKAPKIRNWDGNIWSTESELGVTGDNVLYTRMATSPISSRFYERIVVTVSNNGYLTAYVWNGNSWVVTSNIGYVGNNRNYRGFDVAYEEASGRALLVYAVSTSDTAKDLAYRVWDGAAWSAETYINDPSASDVEAYWVSLASKPGSNEVGLLYVDGKQNRVASMIWSGSGWGSSHQLSGAITNNGRDHESIALAYEQTTGNLMVMCGEADLIRWNRWTGSAWGTSATFDMNTGVVKDIDFLTLKANPGTPQLMALSTDEDKDLCTAYWSGAAWSAATIHDTDISYKDQRCADVAWEPTGNKAILVWSTDNQRLWYRTWSSATTSWASAASVDEDDGKDDPWIQLRRNPRTVTGDVKVLGASMSDDKKLRTFRWDGANLVIGTAYVTLDSITNSYENFEIEFQRYGQTSEQSCIVELMGTCTQTDLVQLINTISQSFDTGSVDVTMQLYNYGTGAYPTSGDGILTYTSSADANTVETYAQTINDNLANFKEPGTNQWKIKLTAVKSTSTTFKMKVDLASYWISYISSHKAAVELSGTTDTNNWYQIENTLDSAINISGATITAQLYKYSTASYPTSGDGYLTYSSAANLDQTRTMTITTTPTNFRDASGNWRMKITSEKSGNSPFNLKIDWSQLKDWYKTGYATDFYAEFKVDTQGKTIDSINLLYWGYYDTASVDQLMYAYNWDTDTWDILGNILKRILINLVFSC